MINDRRITNRLNWVLDNLVLPYLRDSKIFMGIWFRLLFGNKSKCFMGFKERAPHLNQEEYEKYYQLLSDVHLQRDTDLTGECVQRILSRIQGESVLDVGCGKGYLMGKIASEKGIRVVGVDIAASEQQETSSHITFVRHNVQTLPFEDRSFDTVLCTHTIEHLPAPLQTVREIRRVAARKIIIVVPRQREYRYTFDLHIHFFPYIFSLQKIMRNERALCDVIGNDIYYEEEVV